jgi:hypothetical protein
MRGWGQVRYFRAPPQDQGIGSALSGDLVDLITERFVYATLGTVFNTRHRLREAILAALGGVPAKVLFTTGRGVDLHRVEILGRNITLKSFLPQSLVVLRAALIVSHAGLGTIIGALYAGVPMVLISIGVDHPVNAERAAAARGRQGHRRSRMRARAPPHHDPPRTRRRRPPQARSRDSRRVPLATRDQRIRHRPPGVRERLSRRGDSSSALPLTTRSPSVGSVPGIRNDPRICG